MLTVNAVVSPCVVGIDDCILGCIPFHEPLQSVLVCRFYNLRFELPPILWTVKLSNKIGCEVRMEGDDEISRGIET